MKRIKALLGFRVWFYRSVFDTSNGRFVIADLLRHSGYWDSSHTPGDPYQTAFNEGQRRIINRILKLSRMTEEELGEISRVLADQEKRLGSSPLEEF